MEINDGSIFVEKRDTCISCNSRKIKKIVEIKSNQYYMIDTNEYHAWICQDCSLLFVNPMPSIKFLQHHYNTAFDHETLMLPRKKKDDLKTINEMVKYGNKNKLKFYEIGIGKGYFIKHVYEAGLEVRGCDFSQKMTSLNFPFKIDNGRFEDYGYDREFDIVYTSHVMEHSTDPINFLKAICKSLKPGGIVVVRVPNKDSLYSRLANIFLQDYKWDTLFPVPDHLTVFGKKSLKILLENNGFLIEKSIVLPLVNDECNLTFAYFSIVAKAFVLRVFPLFGIRLQSSSVIVKNKDVHANAFGKLLMKLIYYSISLDRLVVFFLSPIYKIFDLGEDLFCIARKIES